MRKEDDSDRQRRRRRRRGRGGGEDAREAAPRETHAPREDVPQRAESEARGERFHEPAMGNGPEMPAGELAERGRRLAEDLFRAMGFEARVTANAESDSVEVKAEIGQDSELITGEKGEVRQSIQHLLNRMLNRGGTSRYHLQLEINDFWARRETELKEMAQRLADEAVADDSEKLTEYLNAQERRVVHVALRDDARVKTFGLGDGLIKKVAIAPVGVGEEQRPGS
jgi:spoIIIJ-associated protein